MSRILIVDDDDQLRKSFHRLLSEEGYTIQSAASGEAGLDLVRQALPDLVILDMRLPGINGLETFQAIHHIDAKLPVIIMTANGTTETAMAKKAPTSVLPSNRVTSDIGAANRRS